MAVKKTLKAKAPVKKAAKAVAPVAKKRGRPAKAKVEEKMKKVVKVAPKAVKKMKKVVKEAKVAPKAVKKVVKTAAVSKTHGLTGKPKSKAHKEAISRALTAAHARKRKGGKIVAKKGVKHKLQTPKEMKALKAKHSLDVRTGKVAVSKTRSKVAKKAALRHPHKKLTSAKKLAISKGAKKAQKTSKAKKAIHQKGMKAYKKTAKKVVKKYTK